MLVAIFPIQAIFAIPTAILMTYIQPKTEEPSAEEKKVEKLNVAAAISHVVKDPKGRLLHYSSFWFSSPS